MDYDIIVIGGGVVGLACAEIFSLFNFSTLVIERHSSFGNETSSRNSEVIHSGIYYPKNSLKAKFCVSGEKVFIHIAMQTELNIIALVNSLLPLKTTN